MLFTNYAKAKDAADWMDVIAPTTAKNFAALRRRGKARAVFSSMPQAYVSEKLVGDKPIPERTPRPVARVKQKARRPLSPGFVYVMASEYVAPAANVFKIGQSTDPGGRADRLNQ